MQPLTWNIAGVPTDSHAHIRADTKQPWDTATQGLYRNFT